MSQRQSIESVGGTNRTSTGERFRHFSWPARLKLNFRCSFKMGLMDLTLFLRADIFGYNISIISFTIVFISTNRPLVPFGRVSYFFASQGVQLDEKSLFCLVISWKVRNQGKCLGVDFSGMSNAESRDFWDFSQKKNENFLFFLQKNVMKIPGIFWEFKVWKFCDWYPKILRNLKQFPEITGFFSQNFS